MHKNFIHKVDTVYGENNSKVVKYNKDEWERLMNLDEFNVKNRDETKSIIHNDFDNFDEEECWNGVVRNPVEFDIENKNAIFVNSDYYTYKTVKKDMLDNVRNYNRELAASGNISSAISMAVTATLVSEDDLDKFLYVKRSEDVGVYPGFNSVVPSGGVDDKHDTLAQCVHDEFDEELFDVNNGDIDIDYYYTGAIIDLVIVGFNISAMGIVKNGSLEEVKEMAESNFEFDYIDIGEFSDVGTKFDKFNTTQPGLYSMLRAKEERENIYSSINYLRYNL